MEHPQPAFDFVMGLPVDGSVNEDVFLDWWAYNEIDAEHGDNIADYPRIWEFLELPDVLADLSLNDYVSIQPFTGRINLNGAAIGLGLENVRYSPELFGGVVCSYEEYDATAILCFNNVLFAVGETAEDASDLIKYMCETLKNLELAEPEMFDGEAETGRVTDFTESRREY